MIDAHAAETSTIAACFAYPPRVWILLRVACVYPDLGLFPDIFFFAFTGTAPVDDTALLRRTFGISSFAALIAWP